MKRLILFLVVALAIGACFRGAGLTRQREGALLKVDNQAFLDMTVYVARGAHKVRLGIATGSSTTRFNIPGDIVAGSATLTFIADPIGNSNQTVSEQIDVYPGDEVTMVIPPN